MSIRDELTATIAFVKLEQPVLKGFFELVAIELDNTSDEQLRDYVDNHVGLWGVLHLLALNSLELNVEYTPSFIENVLRFAKEGFACGDKEKAH